jgi:hypothetical protein
MQNLYNSDRSAVGTWQPDAATRICDDHTPRGARQNIYDMLYRTDRGAWVMHHVNRWQGAQCWSELVSPEEAARFAVHCGLEDRKLPQELREIAEQQLL